MRHLSYCGVRFFHVLLTCRKTKERACMKNLPAHMVSADHDEANIGG